MHELTQRANSMYEFAYSGQPAWHNLGQQLQAGASIEDWVKQSGLDWEVFESIVSYQTISGPVLFPDKRVLFRSDSQAPLSIVSSDYHVVQPGEVLEFFRDVTEKNGFTLSAAGSMFGGKRFWATAEVGKDFCAVDGDKINGHLMLVTSVDGTLATQAKFVSTRVVCNNTLTIALGENSKRSVRKTHASSWNPDEFKIDLGILDAGWNKFMTNIEKLVNTPVSDSMARLFLQNKFYDKEVAAESQGIGNIKKVNTLFDLFKNGTGSEFSKGTAYGLLNAATELYTHGLPNRDTSHQFWNSAFGKDDSMKTEIFNDLLELAA